jgi:hypothetical protein
LDILVRDIEVWMKVLLILFRIIIGKISMKIG